ncbi:hypothetical protein NHX12_029895 [Muraenolepis orangiensis]|uniref:Uncharacterized protein n=1 Tax=Muraenolepis orangiensis TaxID=630683 RepID=A0A9Q0E8G8_9TELE|nr:hypothetical protein NHX12_029895 [Muraenolepis orangiensis]
MAKHHEAGTTAATGARQRPTSSLPTGASSLPTGGRQRPTSTLPTGASSLRTGFQTGFTSPRHQPYTPYPPSLSQDLRLLCLFDKINTDATHNDDTKQHNNDTTPSPR